jgi:electron transport complex protein RnfC
MIDDADLVAEGVELLKKYLDVKKVVIGIEKNKPKAIEKMNELAAKDSVVIVKALPSVYPQGGEKVLIYNCVGKVVPEGKLPIDVGVIVMNCTTLTFLAKYIKTGMPLTEKVMTVDGSAVANPQNVIAPIGTPVGDVFDFCGGFKCDPEKVLYGGPMMGIAVPDLSVPVLKQTNAILALDKKETNTSKTTACIRCGKCTNTCPFGLNPAGISKAYKNDDVEMLEKLGADICMLCGCCSFVCPAKRPLAETNVLAKNRLMAERAKKKEGNA